MNNKVLKQSNTVSKNVWNILVKSANQLQLFLIISKQIIGYSISNWIFLPRFICADLNLKLSHSIGNQWQQCLQRWLDTCQPFCVSSAPCGSGSCRIDPLRFLAGWRKRRLNQVLLSFGLVCVYVCSFYRLFRFFELTVFGCRLIQFC